MLSSRWSPSPRSLPRDDGNGRTASEPQLRRLTARSPLGIAIGLDLGLGVSATTAATINSVTSARDFIRGDTDGGSGALALGLSQALIAAFLLVGALFLWRRRPRGVVLSGGGAVLVFIVARQAAEAGAVVVAAVLFVGSVLLLVCITNRSTNDALGITRRKPGGS